MMGRKALAGKLFYQVSLEELVPDGHLLRRVAEAVDFGVARRLTARFTATPASRRSIRWSCSRWRWSRIGQIVG